jgi:hypothetical protein
MAHNSKFDINKSFVSIYDKFLKQFDQSHTLSASQVKEIEKHARIEKLRDNKSTTPSADGIWEEF